MVRGSFPNGDAGLLPKLKTATRIDDLKCTVGHSKVAFSPPRSTASLKLSGRLWRNGTPDRAAVAVVFEKHDMTLLGPPITDD
jgi:hypothetical protein